MKKCTKCLEIKELNKFAKDKNSVSGKYSSCRECEYNYRALRKSKDKQKQLNWYAENKEHAKNKNLIRRYGITLEDYNKIFAKQNGKCKICDIHQSEFKIALSVDHCHKTGNIRGLLCRDCNTSLGKFKDDPDVLRTAADYLEGKLV